MGGRAQQPFYYGRVIADRKVGWAYVSMGETTRGGARVWVEGKVHTRSSVYYVRGTEQYSYTPASHPSPQPHYTSPVLVILWAVGKEGERGTKGSNVVSLSSDTRQRCPRTRARYWRTLAVTIQGRCTSTVHLPDIANAWAHLRSSRGNLGMYEKYNPHTEH